MAMIANDKIMPYNDHQPALLSPHEFACWLEGAI